MATLSPAAKAAWIAFYNAHAAEQAGLTGELASAWSKMEETAARLALVIHYVRWASQPVIDDTAATENELFGDGTKAATADSPPPLGDVLDADSIAAGVALIQWFKGEAVRVYAMLRESSADGERRRLAEWIRAKGGSVTARDVQAGCRWLRASGKAEAALEDLAASGFGKWESSPSARRGHVVRRLVLTTLTVDVGTVCADVPLRHVLIHTYIPFNPYDLTPFTSLPGVNCQHVNVSATRRYYFSVSFLWATGRAPNPNSLYL